MVREHPPDPLFWRDDPEELQMLRQLGRRIGKQRLWAIDAALNVKADLKAAEIVDAIGAPGKLDPKAAAKLIEKLVATITEWVSLGYAEAPLNKDMRIATFLKIWGFEPPQIGKVFGKNASSARTLCSRANERVKKMRTQHGGQRDR